MMVTIMRMPGGAYAVERGEPAECGAGRETAAAAEGFAAAEGQGMLKNQAHGAPARAAWLTAAAGGKRVKGEGAGAIEVLNII